MKKNFLPILIFSFLICSRSLSSEPCQLIHDEIDEGLYYQDESSLEATIQKYLSTFVPGLVVGANAGIMCAFFDHLVPPMWPLFWYGSCSVRTKMINDISNDYQKRHVRHDKLLMELCAFIASWLSYYKTYEAVHKKPPF